MQPLLKTGSLKKLSVAAFSRKIGSGFAATVALAILITVVSVYALRSVTSTNDALAFNHAQDLFDVEKLRTVAQQKVAIARGFLLTRDGLFVEDGRMADLELRTVFDRLEKRAATLPDKQALVKLRAAEKIHESSLQHAYRLAKGKSHRAKVSQYFNRDTMPKFDNWERALAGYSKIKERQMDEARMSAHEAAVRAMRLIIAIALGALALAMTLAFVLTRTLTELYDEVRVAVRAREDVLAIVSHDLKNPLSSILLTSSMLINNPEVPLDQQNRMARTIHVSAQQMKKLIEDLLDFVKVEFGKMRVVKKTEDPHALLNDVITVFTPLAREKNILLHRAVANDVSVIECERARILQVLSNLVGNAIKFTPQDGGISINITAVGGETLFWVRDTGPGLPPEQLSRVFDRYWQGEQKEHQGVGLGLAIAKGLIEAHGGRIWAESSPGEGSTFYFTLPRAGYKPEPDHRITVEGLRTALRLVPARARAGADTNEGPRI